MPNHDNPAKNRVRDAWMEFLPASFSLRSGPVGLYFPEENREFSGYAAKALRPFDLVGVEHDPARLPEVIRRSGGVRIISGNPLDAVNVLIGERAPTLSFANLDFEGSYDTVVGQMLSMYRILSGTRAAPASLGVTSYAARRGGAKTGRVNLAKFGAAFGRIEETLGEARRMEMRYDVAHSYLVSKQVVSFAHLSREIGFLWWMVMGMGLVEYDKATGYGRLDQEFAVRELADGLRRIASAVPEDACGPRLVEDRAFAAALERRRVQAWPTAYRHFIYYSASRQPMQTWFLRFRRTEKKEQKTLRDLLRQVWELAVQTELTFVSSDGTSVGIP